VLAINVGDTGPNDADVSGYLDNVEVSVGGATTIYEFEATPVRKGGLQIRRVGGVRLR
jgi:hypothetical protein